MKVLMITGDKNFASSERFALQRTAVEELAVVYWGRGSLWPKIPSRHFDVVTAQDPLLRGAFAWRAAKKLEARLNIQVHMDLQVLSRWKLLLARFMLYRADSVRVVSEKIKKQIETLGARAPVHVLPVFVDVDRFRDVAHLRASKSDLLGKTILWVGRFEDEKDPLLAISVLEQVLKAGVDAKLVMLGRGSLEGELRRRAKNLPVEFPGWQDTVPFLQTADVVLCTSRRESWGASIVEALAAGVPVVAPNVGIAREAGARIVVGKSDFPKTVEEVLQSCARGELKLKLLSKNEWARAWRETL